MRRSGYVRFLAITAICAAILLAYFAGRPALEGMLHRGGTDAYPATDFAIFYCAGQSLDEGRNPYLVEPLRSCERSVWSPGYLRGYAEPAALPGYAVVPFALLAKLPFTQAKLLWLVVSCLLFGVAVAAGARLSKVAPVYVGILLFVPIALLSVRWGQLGPVICASIFSSALLLRLGRPRAAACAALVATIEPHIALPVLAALICFVPKSRASIVVGGALLAAVHFVVLGTSTGLAYFTQVLPAMSHAELTAADQYGTVWALHRFGLNASAAGLGADALYVAAIVASLAVVGVALRRFGDRAFVVAVPALLGVLAAPYLHDVELCVALVLPLCALGATQYRLGWSALAAAMAVPWYTATHDTIVAAFIGLACAVFVGAGARRNLRHAAAAAFGSIVVAVVLLLWLRHLPLGALAAGSASGYPGPLAAQSWGVYLRAQPQAVAVGLQTVAPKVLTWIAFLLAAVCAIWRRRALAESPS